jgi:hypothetical protein
MYPLFITDVSSGIVPVSVELEAIHMCRVCTVFNKKICLCAGHPNFM